ncbi:hypothetical protein CCACVL1_16191 [Corchorus capsularis]|uniref:Uncharacterized protein n=1 Tax=Corchorus capsularis TaxID=210143 RepID=A0A1R3HYD9_COCAP|nr:hypothetical protein CCACVL1_16191 [Corchorus capsularis]
MATVARNTAFAEKAKATAIGEVQADRCPNKKKSDINQRDDAGNN